ncbi:lipopolysaccharide biosynthesis protein [Mangrovibacillus cuniculi]|uniref:Oligosaccharide flippase family protein n=1 Tax=Mangrovibacillus cuniculi TaxID=2593652 RepID=A0A7S8HG57_9BACI|nr:oligosaccharide flippase family protein [Mangrovibacillus cuniculi]QPC47644.1 oligosaccharide flippase family protein [Mangrovibacillus cuniculi]
MSKVKRFFATSGIYFIGSVLSKLIGILLLPLYTSQFSPDEFGSYDLVVTLISFFAPIAFFQIWDGMFRFSFDKHKSNEKYSVISNSFSVLALGVFIYTIIYTLVYNQLDFEHALLIFFYGISIAIQYQYTFISRAFLRNKLFIVTGLINSLLNAIFNIILILWFDLGIESLYVAAILGISVQVAIIELRLNPLKNFRLDKLNIQQQLDMIKFSIPLCIAAVSYWMLSGYTKVVISQQLGTSANGLYAIASKFTAMITMVISVFQYAWNEIAYLMSADGDRKSKYKKSITYIFKVVIIGSGIFMLLIKIIFPYIIDPAYHNAISIVPLSLIGVAANAFANFVGTIFMAEKRTRWIFWTTVVAAGINVICLWIFIPIWGLQGAVGALSLSFVAIAIFRLYATSKLFDIKLDSTNLLYIFFLAIITYIFFAIDNILILFISIIVLISIATFSLREILFALLRTIKLKK